MLDGAWVSDDCLQFDCVNQRLSECNVFDARVVKPINIFPEVDLLFFVICSFLIELLFFILCF